MAKAPSRPIPQQKGSQQQSGQTDSPTQQQGGTPRQPQQQAEQPVIRDWAAF